MSGFLELLKQQRWDDHRYYHHSRINQSLHLLSAMSFVYAYILVLKDPAAAALTGWLVAMTSRQIGHFFFEPKGYDNVNRATHEYKEEVKVGYNLRRKMILMMTWLLSPLILLVDPSLLHTLEPHDTLGGFVRHVGYLWLIIGAGGLIFRTVHLLNSKMFGPVWFGRPRSSLIRSMT